MRSRFSWKVEPVEKCQTIATVVVSDKKKSVVNKTLRARSVLRVSASTEIWHGHFFVSFFFTFFYFSHLNSFPFLCFPAGSLPLFYHSSPFRHESLKLIQSTTLFKSSWCYFCKRQYELVLLTCVHCAFCTLHFALSTKLVFSERELKFMFAICHRPSVCLSSVVCNVRAPYSGDWNFRQCFYAMWYLGHPMTFV